MGQISLSLPQSGQPHSTEDVKVGNDLTTIQNAINGNLDSTNVTAPLAQSAGVNQVGQTVKGAVNIAASQSTSSTTYTTLATPDQVTGIVLPSNGLIAIWYQATWQESVSTAARAAFFISSNQLKANTTGNPTAPTVQETSIGGTSATNTPLYSFGAGLASGTGGAAYTGDVTTGQIVGAYSNVTGVEPAGPCYVFAAPGTYTISVNFKASSGSVTASNRKLWVQALSFS